MERLWPPPSHALTPGLHAARWRRQTRAEWCTILGHLKAELYCECLFVPLPTLTTDSISRSTKRDLPLYGLEPNSASKRGRKDGRKEGREEGRKEGRQSKVKNFGRTRTGGRRVGGGKGRTTEFCPTIRFLFLGMNASTDDSDSAG